MRTFLSWIIGLLIFTCDGLNSWLVLATPLPSAQCQYHLVWAHTKGSQVISKKNTDANLTKIFGTYVLGQECSLKKPTPDFSLFFNINTDSKYNDGSFIGLFQHGSNGLEHTKIDDNGGLNPIADIYFNPLKEKLLLPNERENIDNLLLKLGGIGFIRMTAYHFLSLLKHSLDRLDHNNDGSCTQGMTLQFHCFNQKDYYFEKRLNFAQAPLGIVSNYTNRSIDLSQIPVSLDGPLVKRLLADPGYKYSATDLLHALQVLDGFKILRNCLLDEQGRTISDSLPPPCLTKKNQQQATLWIKKGQKLAPHCLNFLKKIDSWKQQAWFSGGYNQLPDDNGRMGYGKKSPQWTYPEQDPSTGQITWKRYLNPENPTTILKSWH